MSNSLTVLKRPRRPSTQLRSLSPIFHIPTLFLSSNLLPTRVSLTPLSFFEPFLLAYRTCTCVRTVLGQLSDWQVPLHCVLVLAKSEGHTHHRHFVFPLSVARIMRIVGMLQGTGIAPIKALIESGALQVSQRYRIRVHQGRCSLILQLLLQLLLYFGNCALGRVADFGRC